MSEWAIEIRVKVNSQDPQNAAMLCAHLLSMAVDAGMPIEPQFIGVLPQDRTPNAIDEIIAQARGESPQAPVDQARGVFDGIMGTPDM